MENNLCCLSAGVHSGQSGAAQYHYERTIQPARELKWDLMAYIDFSSTGRPSRAEQPVAECVGPDLLLLLQTEYGEIQNRRHAPPWIRLLA